MIARHCDRHGCDSWKRIDDVEVVRWGNPGWVTVDLGDDTGHFCSLACLVAYGATALKATGETNG
ncbi:hypothetical protein [Nocardia rhizosphaerae]|uniref:Uncharacterized protein n=1 Tax=Nocardia rhizosphaerae TaxID=1691571 RepID=A0ABV8LER1_9NOCA